MSRFIFITFAITLLWTSASLASERGIVKVVKSPSGSKNTMYRGNRDPLLPSPLIKLPVGSVRPEGWLRKQLELQAEGFIGRLSEISPWCKIETSSWTNPKGEGENGWEELPYWLKGYIDLGYVLGNDRIIKEATKWVEGMLQNQRPDGYFGPESNRKAMDLWPNMAALSALRTHYEATGDKRVISLMTNYFKWLNSLPLEQILPGSWQKVRGGDNLDTIYWLYNQTGDKWLLDLARVNHERTSDWTGGVASLHGVNFAQCFREPAQYYQQTKDIRYLNATERNYNSVLGTYGQVPGGGLGADENCRPGFTGPRQATETCTWVEFMYSHEMLAGITGDVKWADRCEEIAFNSLPPSMTPDLKGLHYLTAPNQIQLDRQSKAPMIQNGGDMFSYDPRSYRCCQHNVAFGWPYFSEYLWMATPGNGLAAVMYSASKVKAKVGKGVVVEITETTDYPFDETVTFAISTPKDVRFPLYLRIPEWCEQPRLSLNSGQLTVPSPAKGWILVDRSWQNGDKIQLEMPMEISVKVWEKNRNAVSVYRGPLAYSLKIGERWVNYRETDPWPAFEVYPTTPWNYGLVYDTKNPATSFQVIKSRKAVAGQPFTPDNAPIIIRAKGKKIPQWKQESNGMIGEVQKSPVKSDEPVEEITLIPMGCARLRVSSFPVIGEGPDARDWEDLSVVIEASYSNPGDSISAINDDLVPSSSADTTIPRFTWWDHRSTEEWIVLTFNNPRKLSSFEVYWFDDTSTGGGCSVPQSWKLLWWDGKAWQPVAHQGEFEVKKDTFNKVTFAPIETTKLRLEAKLRSSRSGGILECRIGE